MNCAKCGRKLGCGCQKRVASDGTSGCNNCIPQYEVELNNKRETPVSLPDVVDPPKDINNGNIDPMIVGLQYQTGKNDTGEYNNFQN